MDLDIIGKQMLEALAVQGQIASLETKLAGFERQTVKVARDIQVSMDNYSSTIRAREQAEVELDKAISNTEIAEEFVTQAKADLKSAESATEEAKEELDRYSDDALEGLDNVTNKLEEDKKVIEANIEEVVKELNTTRQDLEARQAELKAQGVEVNLGGVELRPKHIVI